MRRFPGSLAGEDPRSAFRSPSEAQTHHKREVNENMNMVYLAMIIISIISALTMFFHVRYNSILSAKSKRYFALMFLCIIIVAASESLGDLMNASGSYGTLHMIVKCIEFSAVPWPTVLMALGCNAVERPKPFVIVLCAHMVFECLALPFQLVIRIDSMGHYSRGPLYFITVLVNIASLIYLLAAFIRLSKKYGAKKMTTPWLAIMMMILAMIPPLIDGKWHTSVFGIVLCAVILYEYYQSLMQKELYENQLDYMEKEQELLKNQLELAHLKAENAHLKGQLGMAVKLKFRLMPYMYPVFPEEKSFDLYMDLNAAEEIGGDYYDFFRTDDAHIAIVIANVLDGGPASALFMVAFKILVRHYAELRLAPARLLSAINSYLYDNNEDDLTMSCWYGEYEIGTGHITAVNAGHETPIIISGGSAYPIPEDQPGWMIGMMSGVSYREYEFELKKGDSLFLYTDGSSGAENSNGERFTAEKICDVIAEAEGARDAVARLQTVVARFTGGTRPESDAAMVCLKQLS